MESPVRQIAEQGEGMLSGLGRSERRDVFFQGLAAACALVCQIDEQIGSVGCVDVTV